MLTREYRGALAPDERSTDARHFVCGHLFTVSRTTKHNPERVNTLMQVNRNGLSGIDAECRVIIECVVLCRAMINHFVAQPPEVILEHRAEFEAGVVGSDMDAHTLVFL